MKNIFYFILIFVSIKNTFSQNIDSVKLYNNKAIFYYKQKNYEKALEYYHKIEKMHGISSALYYNIGNCYFRLKNISKAILYYERALKIDPNDEYIKHNLQLANAYVTDKINEIAQPFYKQWFMSLIHLFGPDTWAILSIITFSICLVSIYLIFVSNKIYIIQTSKVILIICAFLFTTCIVSSYARYKEITSKKTAIITSDVVEIKSSPDEKSTVLFVLHEGTKLFITNEYEDWYEIKIADGNSGWIKKEHIEII
ncbi:MAG: tetratricopeptide repeat protein [Bacteroidales bacterium]|nr:tetratricopeptide repeat protein [Bacteroidales bacterium]